MLFDYGKTQILAEMDHFVSQTFFPRHLTIWNVNHQHHNILLFPAPPHLKMFVRRKWKLNETIKKASETKDKVQGNNHPGGADGGGGWMTH